METTMYRRSKTTDFFHKISLLIYIFGLPNFWIEDLKLSKRFVKFYDKFSIFNNVLIYLLALFELASFFTQTNLTEKQKSNLLLYSIAHSMLCVFHRMISRLENKVKLVMYNLTVELKRVHNDLEVERQMIRSTITYLSALFLSCLVTMVMYTLDGYWKVVRLDKTFTTLVTAYPDVEDKSDLANVVRALCYILWWVLLSRFLAVCTLGLSLTVCLSHQYKNLQSYFVSLSNIFEREDLNQTEKEEKYETGFKVGIKLHSDTIRCTQQTQDVCQGVFSGQIIFNILLLVILMTQMAMASSERTLVDLFAAVCTAIAVLISTGFYMCNAGDVTIEASNLATAIYFSGWYHCRGQSSVRIRKLIVLSMSYAQQPVVFKGLGYIALSYESYIKIVKVSYSVFSVLY